MVNRIMPLLLFFYTINAQIALPTFQAVHKPHTTTSSGTFTFTNCSATGRYGPTQSQVNSTYTSGNSLYGEVTINTQGIQEWTVPATTTYTIEAWGAQGGIAGDYNGGKGAYIKGDFSLTEGETIKIIVGQQGIAEAYHNNFNSWGGAGGGGGTFVVKTPFNNTSSILVIAGGGGGPTSYSGNNSHTHGEPGLTGASGGDSGTSGGSGSGCSGPATGGSNGYGGEEGCAAGGGGFLGNGDGGGHRSSGGEAFINGGEGGNSTNNHGRPYGGFGGGGAGSPVNGYGGGGGGFSGGGGGPWTSSVAGNGGGGGSYNSGDNQDNSAGIWESHGKVIITY